MKKKNNFIKFCNFVGYLFIDVALFFNNLF